MAAETLPRQTPEVGAERVIYPDSTKPRASPLYRTGQVRFAACMSGKLLSPADRAHFLRMLRVHTPSPVHRRMNALLLLDDGWAAERARHRGDPGRFLAAFRFILAAASLCHPAFLRCRSRHDDRMRADVPISHRPTEIRADHLRRLCAVVRASELPASQSLGKGGVARRHIVRLS